MLAFDGGDDLVGVCGPDEGLGSGVGFFDEVVDGRLQIDDGSEDTSFQSPVNRRAPRPCPCRCLCQGGRTDL